MLSSSNISFSSGPFSILSSFSRGPEDDSAEDDDDEYSNDDDDDEDEDKPLLLTGRGKAVEWNWLLLGVFWESSQPGTAPSLVSRVNEEA